FFRFDIPKDITNDKDLQAFYSFKLDRLYRSFVLFPGHYYIPRPENSCSYFIDHYDDHISYKRCIGPFEREWLIFGNGWNNDYDQEGLNEVKRIYEDIKVQNVLDNIENGYGGFSLVQELSDPEFLISEIIPG